MTSLVPAIGLAVGVFYGVFGAGASAVATPLLALAGVPPLAAVASPLPATVPAALAAAASYVRSRSVDWPTARRVLAAGTPATVAGAWAAPHVDGGVLLGLSAAVVAAMGWQLARPARAATARRSPAPPRLVAALAAAAGFATGLLANSGGFLLVPLFVLVVGLTMHRAAGTSLVVAAVLSLPSVATHALLGDIDWTVALLFGAGLVPGSVIGGLVAQHGGSARRQRVFGTLLVLTSVWFVAARVV